MDGIYHGENKQLPSSSSGNTRAQTLFNEYQKSVFIVDNRYICIKIVYACEYYTCINKVSCSMYNLCLNEFYVLDFFSSAPGFAFKNSLPYIEFKELELQTLASTKTQLQFYQVINHNMYI